MKKKIVCRSRTHITITAKVTGSDPVAKVHRRGSHIGPLESIAVHLPLESTLTV
jgi:hypothetical protein